MIKEKNLCPAVDSEPEKEAHSGYRCRCFQEYQQVADQDTRTGSDVVLEQEILVEVPRRFQVLLHNDDYTTMEFVVEILMNVFRKSADEAVRIMLNVHENGIGLAGVYVKEVAETKIMTVHRQARENGFPLLCSMEPE